MQGVEDGNTIMPDHHGLAVQRERLGPQLCGRAGDRRVALRPVIAAAGEQANGLAVPPHDDLDLIASDLQIDGFRKNGPRLRAVSGSAPRREPLTYEAKSAIREIESATYQIFGQLERLTESALKGLTFEAKTRAEDDPLWTGIAAAAERRREILRRHRTGKGVWYAVIEGLRSEPGSNRGEIFTLAYEKCDSLKAAEAAARCLLIKNAEHFSQLIGIEPHVYSELEWSPP
jgi:hypothetical protein